MIYTTETKVELDSSEIDSIAGIIKNPAFSMQWMIDEIRCLAEEIAQKAYDKGIRSK